MSIYYSPESYGLEVVGEVEFSDMNYQFDTTVVWRDVETGDLYYADDSGCSCPCPFEGHNRETITKIGTSGDLMEHLKSRLEECYDDSDRERAKVGCAELIVKVMSL